MQDQSTEPAQNRRIGEAHAGSEYGTSIESQNWRSTCRIKSTEPAQNRRIGEARIRPREAEEREVAEMRVLQVDR